jgi:aryl-alcohol dehydrogenase-like predicted oxidoreductase
MTISLGLGLLSIGRTWGHFAGAPPREDEAHALLTYAAEAGINFFDTAPAYGASERILGAFLSSLGDRRRALTVATKMGEHWQAGSATTTVDHSYDALMGSLERSLALLGQIDVLQLHKASVDTVTAPDTVRALEHARGAGITRFGASVSDVATGRAAIRSGLFGALQFPFNVHATSLAPLFAEARAAGVEILVNRPYAMGRIQADATGDPLASMTEALRLICNQPFKGVILTGTRSPAHLAQSLAAFRSLPRT